jgi:hypothetical protein
MHSMLTGLFDRYAVYVEGFLACAEVCLHARWMDAEQRDDAGPSAADLDQFALALQRLDAFSDRIRTITEQAALPHQVVMLMDHRRTGDIAREGHALLRAARAIG